MLKWNGKYAGAYIVVNSVTQLKGRWALQTNSRPLEIIQKKINCFLSKTSRFLVTNHHFVLLFCQDHPTLYFLHADSHAAFNLAVPTSNSSTSSTMGTSPAASTIDHPVLRPCLGKVVEKEYCYARKDENRYKVSRGTRFYRVKVRPRSPGRFADSATVAAVAAATAKSLSSGSHTSLSSSRRERLDCNFCSTLLNKKRHSIK